MKTQNRDNKGKFSKTKKWTGRIVLAFVLALVFTYFLPSGEIKYATPTMVQEVMAEARGATYEEKIANVKAKMLKDLSVGCETKDVADPDGTIIFDSNAQPSIGRFQFQRKTVIHYVKKYEGRDITNSEAIAIAIDPVKSQALAEKIIFTEKEGAGKDWVNCNRKLSLTDKVAIIKELSME